jgi:hydrogenase expression/formation protein HypC
VCLAVPGKVIEIDDKKDMLRMAKVDFAGVVKEICLDWVPEVKLNDFVIVHAGFALNIVDEKEAKETLRLFHEMGTLTDDEYEKTKK